MSTMALLVLAQAVTEGATGKEKCSPFVTIESAQLLSNVTVSESAPPLRIFHTSDDTFISLPRTNYVAPWGVPLKIQYAPSDADVQSFHIAVVVNGEIVAESDEMPVSQSAPGTISIRDFRMPLFPDLQVMQGRVSLVINLNGTMCGQRIVTGDVDAPPFLKIDGDESFMPLFMASDEVPRNRRYGKRDPGEDSWATARTIGWLRSRSYRFDDITGLNAPRTSSGRSALGHSGHSNGRQIDLRYADGIGGFSDSLGGMSDGTGILHLLKKAEVEHRNTLQERPAGDGKQNKSESAVSADAPLSKPDPESGTASVPAGESIERLRNWVDANRTIIREELGEAELVHIGNDWMSNLLVEGKFRDHTLVPGVDPWPLSVSERKKIVPVKGHFSHWHINLIDR